MTISRKKKNNFETKAKEECNNHYQGAQRYMLADNIERAMRVFRSGNKFQ